MTRSSFTAILLGGALAGGCSKPNPLFLDTWDVVTDSGGSQSQTSVGTIEPTTVSPPTTTSTDPPLTTTSSTSLTSSSDVTTTTTEPNPTTETTGDPFVCDELDMNGCCEVVVAAEADAFFSDAVDGASGVGCPPAEPPLENKDLECKHISFGSSPAVRVFKDNGEIQAADKGISMMAMRFPTKDGQLLSQDGPVPTDLIDSVQLELAATYNQIFYSDLKFTIYALGASGWMEGDAGQPVSCIKGLASFACLACGDVVGQGCDATWVPMQESTILDVLQTLGVVDAVAGGNSGLAPIELGSLNSPTEWVPMIAEGGMVMAPHSSKFMGTAYPELMPSPGVKIGTHEAGTPPLLRVRVCKQ
ncbi:hypothetical protein [Nannocystis punicea]|uniref:Uncharacterized protein n=1 Tax=Nannocystis punicea TaxID=2995304 RepID=A0ABY7H9Z9_9BACT|nr:hypothetical protein [Nannocystis poenicansa]WAS96103.1 hypothetical protein O0S08_08055 [Nannocystis poenicansa]